MWNRWAAAAFFHDLDTDKDMTVTRTEFLRTPKWDTEKFLAEAGTFPYVLEREFGRVVCVLMPVSLYVLARLSLCVTRFS